MEGIDTSMKIIMIGPVYPFKTGVSHYTGLLFNSLKRLHNVKIFSYKMQYPKFLYKKNQYDYEDISVKVEPVIYCINTANPLNWIQIASKINKSDPDLVIFQWLHPYFAPCFWTISKLIKRANVLFICHNVFPHERFPLDRSLTRITLGTGDFFITHSLSDADDLCCILTNPIYKVAVLPTFNFFKVKNITYSEARESLSINNDKKVLLFFGLIRPYKGLQHLLNAMKYLTDRDQNYYLIIAGDFGESKESYMNLIQKNDIYDNVEIHAGHLSASEVEPFFAACDLVVLPYESATQSAVIQVAYAFEKPVIATDVGGLPDVVLDGKTGYLVEPKNPEQLAEKIIIYFEEHKKIQFSAYISKEAERYSWERMVESIEKLVGEES